MKPLLLILLPSVLPLPTIAGPTLNIIGAGELSGLFRLVPETPRFFTWVVVSAFVVLVVYRIHRVRPGKSATVPRRNFDTPAFDKLPQKQRLLRLFTVGFAFMFGAILIWAVSAWAFNQVALRKAFTAEQIAREHIKVDHVTKPSTVTFSNGQSVNVGSGPANACTACIFILIVPFFLFLGHLARRLFLFDQLPQNPKSETADRLTTDH